MLTIHVRRETSAHATPDTWTVRTSSQILEFETKTQAIDQATALLQAEVQTGGRAQVLLHHDDGTTSEFRSGDHERTESPA